MTLSIPKGRKSRLGAWLRLGLILALAGAGGAAAALLLKNASYSEGMYALEPAADRLDFGEVWEDANYSLALPITNQRGQDIEIERFTKSCNCSRIEPARLTIPARQTREVRLLLDLTAKKPGEFDAAVRDFEVSLTPEIPGERQRMSWTIRGRVRAVMQSELPRIDFGKVSARSQSLPIKRGTLTTSNVVHNFTASCSSPDFRVRVEKRIPAKAKPAGANQFDVVAAMTKVPPRGAIRCTLTVVPELSDGTRLPSRQVEVLGHIVSDMEASPAYVVFEGCSVGSTKTAKLTLRSLTQQAFEVTGMRCEGEGLAVEQQAATSDGGFTFELQQKVGGKGEHNGKVIFRIVRPDASTEEIIVAASYNGF